MTYCSEDWKESAMPDASMLLTLAQRIRRDYAPRFYSPHVATRAESCLSAQQLLAVRDAVRRHYAPQAHLSPPHLQLYAIAPNTVHVYWQAPKHAVAHPCELRVYAQSQSAAAVQNDSVFVYALPSYYGQQALVLPSDAVVSHCYAQLMPSHDDVPQAWRLRSNAIDLPLASPAVSIKGHASSPIAPFDSLELMGVSGHG
jgi:hypothetical protein